MIIEYIEYILGIIIGIAAVAGIAALVTATKSNAKKKKEAHLKTVLKKTQEITSKYRPGDIFSGRGSISAEDRRVMKNSLKNKIPEKLAACEELDARIQGILSCPGASSPDEKLKYLSNHLSELDSFSEQRAAITEEISAVLDAFENIKYAFSNICRPKSTSEEIVMEKRELTDEEEILPTFLQYIETKNRR